MKTIVVAAGLAALICACPASAQEGTVAPLQSNATSGAGVLRAGTSVPLRMVEELTTKGKKLKNGYRFNLETTAAVMVDGREVIPVGSRAVGEVTNVKNKGMWGKSGKIEARLLYVRVGDRQIRLAGQLDDKGVTGTAGVVGSVALLPVAGFFMTGTSARIPIGANVTGYVEEDAPIAFAAAAAPIVVQAPPASGQ